MWRLNKAAGVCAPLTVFIPAIEFNGTHDHLSLSFENNLTELELDFWATYCLHFILLVSPTLINILKGKFNWFSAPTPYLTLLSDIVQA